MPNETTSVMTGAQERAVAAHQPGQHVREWALNVYSQAIKQTKRDAQSRVGSLLLDKNEEKPGTEAYRMLTDV